jgi:hypothetical protein
MKDPKTDLRDFLRHKLGSVVADDKGAEFELLTDEIATTVNRTLRGAPFPKRLPDIGRPDLPDGYEPGGLWEITYCCDTDTGESGGWHFGYTAQDGKRYRVEDLTNQDMESLHSVVSNIPHLMIDVAMKYARRHNQLKLIEDLHVRRSKIQRRQPPIFFEPKDLKFY